MALPADSAPPPAPPAAELSGRLALVTGAGRGIGRAVAVALAGAGAGLVLLGRDADALAETAAACGGAVAATGCLDLADAAALDGRIAGLVAGAPVDILVNNAGIGPSADFLALDADSWQRTFQVNVFAAAALARAVLPGMRARRWGRIVAIASTAGLTGYPKVAAYVASKHALVGLTRALAQEEAGRGITANAVCPGYTATDLAEAAIGNIVGATGRSREEAVKLLTRRNPQGRLVAPAEVAAAVRWLCGPGSDAVNGIALPVAGGEVG